MQHSEEGEVKSGRWVGIEALEGSGHALISEFDYRELEIINTRKWRKLKYKYYRNL